MAYVVLQYRLLRYVLLVRCYRPFPRHPAMLTNIRLACLFWLAVVLVQLKQLANYKRQCQACRHQFIAEGTKLAGESATVTLLLGFVICPSNVCQRC